MKRFNLDELIWFIILVLLGISMMFLAVSGSVVNFIDEGMIKYFYISIVIVILFAAVQISRIFTIKRRKDITNKFIPITFTLCIGVVLLYIFPIIKEQMYANNNYVINYGADTIIVSCDNYEILNNINDNYEDYNNKQIAFLGYVDNSESIEYITLAREAISCCQADKEKILVRVKGITENELPGQWMEVYGKIAFDGEGYYISADEYYNSSEPSEIYFHDHH